MSSLNENSLSPQDGCKNQAAVLGKFSEVQEPVCKLQLDFGDCVEEHENEKPELIAKVDASGVVYACFHKAVVKLDGDLSPLQQNLPSDVDCLALCGDGRNVVVGLRCGQVFIVSFQGETKIVYSRMLPGDFSNLDGDRIMADTVLRQKGQDIYDIIFVMTSGQVIRMCGVDLGNVNALDKLNYSEEMEVLRENLVGEKVYTACMTKVFGTPVVVLGGNIIAVVSEDEERTVRDVQEMKCAIQKLCALENSNLLIGLTEDYHLVAIDVYTLTIVKEWHRYRVCDFELLYGEPQPRVVLLVSPEHNQDCAMSHLIMVTLSDFEEQFRAETSRITFLVGGNTNEMTYFESCELGFLQKKMQFLKGSISHQARLKQLMDEKNLDEAERLAAKEGLDVRPVLKALTFQIVEQLVPWDDTEHKHGLFDQMLDLLGRFEFVGFLGRFCDVTITTDYERTKNLFGYAQRKLDSINFQSKGKISREHAALLCTVSNILLRLNTYQMLYPAHSVQDSKWLEFYLCDLYKECLRFLSLGQLSQAALIWSRHNSSFCMSFAECNVQELTCVPEHVGLEEYLRWLKCVVPVLLNKQPHWYRLLLAAVLPIIRAAEQKQDSWPAAALSFTRQLCEFLHSDKRMNSDVSSVIALDYQKYDETCLVKQFYDLIFILEQLDHLKTKNCIRISFEEFTQAENVEVVYNLLNQVPPRDMAAFQADFLAQYMLDHGLQHDQVLSGYIMSIVADANWWDCSDLPGWEEAASALVHHIQDSAVQEQCIVAVLKSARVPWSETVNDLVQLGVQLTRSLAPEIRQQIQLVDAKLVMKKYGLKNITHVNRKVIQYILRQGREDSLKDALQFASSSQKLTDEVYVIFAQEYISNGEEDRAIELLDSLSPTLAARVWRQSVFRVMANVEQEVPDDEACERHLSSLHVARTRLARLSARLGRAPVDLCCAPDLENMCHIALQRGITLNEKMYSTAKVRSQLLETFLGKFVEAGDHGHGKLRLLVSRLAKLFTLKQEEVLLLLGIQNLDLQKGADLTEKVIELLYLSCETWEKIPVRLHSFVCRVMCSETSPTPETATLIEKMVCSLCAKFGRNELPDWLSLYPWAWMLNQSLCKSAASTKSWRDHYVRWRSTPLYYDSCPSSETEGTATLLSDCLLLVAYYSHKKTWHRTDSSFYLNFNANTDQKWLKSIKHHRKDFLSRMDAVCESLYQRSDLLSLQTLTAFAGSLSMLQTLLDKYSSGTEVLAVRTKLNETVNKCLPFLLLKIISAIRIDPMFALGVRCSFTNFDRWNVYMSRFSSDSYRSKLLTQIGLQFSMISGESRERIWYEDLLKRLHWSEKLIQLEVACSELFREGSSFVGAILDKLISAKCVNLNTIVEYCYDFDVGLFASLTKYLEIVINSWEPVMLVTTNFEGKKEMVVKNDEEEVFVKCKEVVDLLKAEYEKRVSVFLIELIGNINYYHYEMYMCVFRLLKGLNTSHQFRISSIVSYIKTYRRNGPPQQEEMEYWRQMFPDSDGLPPIAEWRLPLKVFIEQDKWKVQKLLSSEININTYNQWLMACGTLPIERDRILGIAIKDCARGNQLGKDSCQQEWSVHQRNSILLKKIKECAEQFGDLEVASAALHFLTHHIPPGVDQSIAAELCYQYTDMWARNKSTPQALQLVEKMRQRFLRCATSNVLYSQGLGQSNYVVFALEPKQLLQLLYQHPSIVDRSYGSTPDLPDINKAAKKLAELHEYDLYDFWPEQVKEWIMPHEHNAQTQAHDDVTMDLTVLLCKQELSIGLEENLIRVCYILQLNSKEEASNFLFSMAFKDIEGLSDYTLRLRALKCLIGFADHKFLECVTYMSLENIRKYMKSLYFVSELQKYGLVYSVDSFEKAAKKSIVRDLMHCHDRSPGALVLMSNMCIEFSVTSTQLWVQLLHQMAKFQMVSQLEHVLLGITGTQYHILRSASGIHAWNTVLLKPFIAADGPGLTAEEERACLHSLCLMQSCSVVDLVDRQTIANHCLRLCRPDMAALLLPYCPQHERHTILQEILVVLEPSKIKASLQEFTRHGLMIAVQVADMLPV